MKTAFLCMCIGFGLLNSAGWCDVYLTKDQALDLVLGTDCEHIYDPKDLSSDLSKELETQNLSGSVEDKKEAHFFLCKKGGAIKSYAFIDEDIGKHLPITYIVGISPEGAVTRTDIMVYREKFGQSASNRSFLSQFEGKKNNEDLQIGSGIKNLAGATYSTKAMSLGVRRALYLWNKFYHQSK